MSNQSEKKERQKKSNPESRIFWESFKQQKNMESHILCYYVCMNIICKRILLLQHQPLLRLVCP